MKFVLGDFRGRVPRRSDRLVDRRFGQVAENVRVESGELRPFRQNALAEAISNPNIWQTETIHRWDDGATKHWLFFPGKVSVLNAPLKDDVFQRLYWTGDSRFDGEPRMSYVGNIVQDGNDNKPAVSFKWGVPAPASAAQITLENPGSDIISDIFMERPFRVVTVTPHGFETDELVQFNITATEVPQDQPEVLDLAEFLNNSEFQVTVRSDNEFEVNNTDGVNVSYTSFLGGTVSAWDGEDVKETRSYVYTYVTALGEEGPPSEPSQEVEATPFQNAILDIPAPDPEATSGRQIENMRIYRTATGTRSAEFFFVAEVPLATAQFEDTVRNLAEAIPSTLYDPPPKNLKGIRAAAEGFLVGHFDNKVAFSEPYLPHAWPTDYQIAVDDRVVAVEIIDNGVVVATEGLPYLLQGVDPRSMVPRRIELDEACVSARSMVSTGYTAIYASPNGLVEVSSGRTRMLTETLISDDEWPRYRPDTMHAYERDGEYIAFWGDETEGGALIIDPRNLEKGVVSLPFWARHGFIDRTEPYLYILDKDERILRWDDPDEPWAHYRWRSRRFNTGYPVNMGGAKVIFDRPLGSEQVTFRLYGDGGLVHETQVVQSDRSFPLPGGYLANDFAVELEGDAFVSQVEVAESQQELDA